jgi:predicted enzyme related to lactoylglutathione lyase
MVERTGYADGEPCWADAITSDTEEAKRFYGEVFGWTFIDTAPDAGNYVMCLKDGQTVAGLTPPSPGTEEAPPMWNVYFSASDLDATTVRFAQAGGKIIMGPLDVPGSGRMLYGFDPNDAAFGIWQPGEHTGADLYGEPGAITWVELTTRDTEIADAFYRSLFGYEQEQLGDGRGFDYTVWKIDGRSVCGRIKMGLDFPPDVPPHWMVYFAVDDADAAAQRVTAAGGEIRQGPFDSPFGRIAVCAGADGALFSVIDESRRGDEQPG